MKSPGLYQDIQRKNHMCFNENSDETISFKSSHIDYLHFAIQPWSNNNLKPSKETSYRLSPQQVKK